MDDPGRADLGGEAGGQAAVDLVQGGQGPGPGLVELALPAGQLPLQVAGGAAEVTEAHLAGVDPWRATRASTSESVAAARLAHPGWPRRWPGRK